MHMSFSPDGKFILISTGKFIKGSESHPNQMLAQFVFVMHALIFASDESMLVDKRH